MVKLTGPMVSTEASGSFGKILTFGKTKGRAIARKRPTPKQPRSGLQVSMRAMMTFLSQQWTNLTGGQQSTWRSLYPYPSPTPYNAFIRDNCERWRSRKPPTKAYPAGEVLNPWAPPDLLVTGGVQHIQIRTNLTAMPDDNWTMLLFHSDAASPGPDVDKLVHVFKVEDLLPHYWTHSPLKPGTHHYRVIPTTTDGNVTWNNYVTRSAIVT